MEKDTIDKIWFDGWQPEVQIKEWGDEWDPLWGGSGVYLTREHIEALLNGKVLESDFATGEYATLLALKEE